MGNPVSRPIFTVMAFPRYKKRIEAFLIVFYRYKRIKIKVKFFYLGLLCFIPVSNQTTLENGRKASEMIGTRLT